MALFWLVVRVSYKSAVTRTGPLGRMGVWTGSRVQVHTYSGSGACRPSTAVRFHRDDPLISRRTGGQCSSEVYEAPSATALRWNILHFVQGRGRQVRTWVLARNVETDLVKVIADAGHWALTRRFPMKAGHCLGGRRHPARRKLVPTPAQREPSSLPCVGLDPWTPQRPAVRRTRPHRAACPLSPEHGKLLRSLPQSKDRDNLERAATF